jgi:septum formation protein
MKKLILASKSPRRQQILSSLGIKFEVVESSIKEINNPRLSLAENVQRNALRKAKKVALCRPSGLIIAADTLVSLNKHILGKPKNIKEARETIKRLNGRTCWVYTGLSLIDVENNKSICDYERTKVTMRKLTDNEIETYLRLDRPIDKAGSCTIEGLGSLLVKRIEGCYYNVLGLPIAKLDETLKKFNLSLFEYII